MNETTNHHEPTDRTQSENQQAPPNPNESASSKADPARSILDSIRAALKNGADEATRMAEEAIPKVKAAASDAAYLLGYGISFAAVFSYVAARELAPDVLKKGCRDGAQDGKSTAEKVATDLKSQDQQAAATSTAPNSASA